MFNSSILDVAMGVAFVFLLMATVCTAVREGLEHMLKTRASYLEYAIRELLFDRKGEGFAKDFYDHPLIQGLYQGEYKPLTGGKPNLLRFGRNMPSYIPSKSFALALIDLAARPHDPANPAPDNGPLNFDKLRASVLAMPNEPVRRLLLAALDASQRDLERARQNIEAWYDGAMDRVSGWYKRSTQGVIFGLALAIACLLNVNTITIVDHLYRDQPLRATVVATAEQAKEPMTYQQAASNLQQMQLPIGWEGGWGAPRTAAERKAPQMAEWDELNPNASEEERAAQLETIQLRPRPWNDVFAPLLGLLITAFAATLGAPFWFDVLNKVMVIRATVKPHEKSREEGSEDRQLPRRYEPAPTGLAQQSPDNDVSPAIKTG